MCNLITSTKFLQDQIQTIIATNLRYVSVDTEFVRQSSYFPKVGLIQIGHQNGVLVIDALTCDLDVLKPLFFNKNIIKVFHSARQDLEIFYKIYGEVPYPLADLQINAGFLGYGHQVSLDTLAEKHLNIHLKKIHRYGDWLTRPLASDLIRYAYDDAATIYTLYPMVQKKLEDSGRTEWTYDLLKELHKWPLTLQTPANILKKCHHDLTDEHQIKQLYTLALWRETQAVQFDKPRMHIIHDKTMCTLLKALPLVKSDYKSILFHEDPKSHVLRHQELRKDLFLYLVDLFENKIPLDIDLSLLSAKRSINKELKDMANQAAQNLNIPVNFFLNQTELLALSENIQNVSNIPKWKQEALNKFI